MKIPFITFNFERWVSAGTGGPLEGHVFLKRIYLPASIWRQTGFGWTPICVCWWRPFAKRTNIDDAKEAE